MGSDTKKATHKFARGHSLLSDALSEIEVVVRNKIDSFSDNDEKDRFVHSLIEQGNSGASIVSILPSLAPRNTSVGVYANFRIALDTIIHAYNHNSYDHINNNAYTFQGATVSYVYGDVSTGEFRSRVFIKQGGGTFTLETPLNTAFRDRHFDFVAHHLYEHFVSSIALEVALEYQQPLHEN